MTIQEISPARKPDAELAEEYRARMTAALEPVLCIMTEAGANKIRVNFNLALDGTGRGHIANLEILKVL